MRVRPCKVFAVIVGGLIAFQVNAADVATPATNDRDVSALHHLWNSYQQAVARKDAKAMLDMYASPDAPVLSALASQSYAVIKAANKQPIPRTFPSTAKDDVVGEIKLPPDQTKNLRIETDGEIGTITWDYSAKVGHGQVVWSVVHTNDGWKIASALFSMNVPAADATNGVN
ncbi:hypothetical protein DWU98_15645 [Dyella monticola]|uniref:DUF4440 domain-containing protein n=1 Tax=Dyella monticola TaxID=1927958 RepID=A0A370WV72_9GAMM|nr:hypothetical protein [Dyella monticola]RDS79875.1 hypothetical protein DWU98_15645 [Dyella monticola]